MCHYYACVINCQSIFVNKLGFVELSPRIWIAVFWFLSICLQLVYFVCAAGCHSFDLSWMRIGRIKFVEMKSGFGNFPFHPLDESPFESLKSLKQPSKPGHCCLHHLKLQLNWWISTQTAAQYPEICFGIKIYCSWQLQAVKRRWFNKPGCLCGSQGFFQSSMSYKWRLGENKCKMGPEFQDLSVQWSSLEQYFDNKRLFENNGPVAFHFFKVNRAT